jgi:hypothetical protein
MLKAKRSHARTPPADLLAGLPGSRDDRIRSKLSDGDRDVDSLGSTNILQVLAGVLRAQARLNHAGTARRQLERAAARIVAVQYVEASIREFCVDGVIRMDTLLNRVVSASGRRHDTESARAMLKVGGGEFSVPVRSALLYGLVAWELARDASDVAFDGGHAVELVIETIQNRRSQIVLTAGMSGLYTGHHIAEIRATVESLLAPLSGRVRAAVAPAGIVLFCVAKDHN